MDSTPPTPVFIPDTYDTMLQKVYLREYAESRYPKVELIRMDRALTVVDDLYNETAARRFLDPVAIHCLPEHEPNKKSLTKYGLEQSRPVLFKVATIHLQDIDYLRNNEHWMLGDLIRWGGDIYEIMDQVKATEGYWGMTNIPFYYILGADYYRAGI